MLMLCEKHDSFKKGTIVPANVAANFQPSAWGFLTTKHSPRLANHGALPVRKKIAAGFGGANRL